MEKPKPARIWLTQVSAEDPTTGELRVWTGPNISAPSLYEAEVTLAENGLGYCQIIGELVAVIDDNTGDVEQPPNEEWWENNYL